MWDLMKNSDLESIIKNLGPDLYGFAYTLIPDDLQAGQLIIDAVSNFLLSKKSLIEKLLKADANSETTQEVQLRLFQIIYETAKKRFHQIQLSFTTEDQKNFFFSLDLDEKAMLYLRVRAMLEINHIEMIMNKDRTQVLAFLNDGRMKMIHQNQSNLQYHGAN